MLENFRYEEINNYNQLYKMTKNIKKLSFYDLRAKKKFVPKEYIIKNKGQRQFGVAINPKTGNECWRILGMKK